MIFLILMNKKGELIEDVNMEIKIIDLNCKELFIQFFHAIS